MKRQGVFFLIEIISRSQYFDIEKEIGVSFIIGLQIPNFAGTIFSLLKRGDGYIRKIGPKLWGPMVDSKVNNTNQLSSGR